MFITLCVNEIDGESVLQCRIARNECFTFIKHLAEVLLNHEVNQICPQLDACLGGHVSLRILHVICMVPAQ